MKKLLIAATLLFFGMAPSLTHAACSNPAANEGDQVYNTTHKVMQFCNGTDWIAMGALSPAAGGVGVIGIKRHRPITAVPPIPLVMLVTIFVTSRNGLAVDTMHRRTPHRIFQLTVSSMAMQETVATVVTGVLLQEQHQW